MNLRSYVYPLLEATRRGVRFHKRRQQLKPILSERIVIQDKHWKPKNVLLCCVDCLRSDHISGFGYFRETTPFLDSHLYRSTAFSRTISAAPWTYPSVASILTGLYPHHHGGFFTEPERKLEEKGPNRLHSDVIELEDIFNLLGYATYLGSSILFTAMVRQVGFRHWLYELKMDGERIVDDFMEKVNRNRSPFFAYLHFGDLHHPIRLGERWTNVFGKLEDLPNLDTWDYESCLDYSSDQFIRYRDNRVRLYDCAIRYVDHQLERLWRFLEEQDILENTVLVITSDHGEEFWEHGGFEREHYHDGRGIWGVGHGHALFNESIYVPLLIWASDLDPKEYHEHISTVDIFPTLLDLTGIEFLYDRMDGKTLMDGPPDKDFILSEEPAYGYDKKAIYFDNYKFIDARYDYVQSLFDLSKDPGEENSIRNVEVEATCREIIRSLDVGKKGEDILQFDKEVKKHLEALGYI